MIPDKAYGAAGEAVAHYSATVDTPQLSQVITEAIQAAAPFIRAEALRDVATRWEKLGSQGREPMSASRFLHCLADEIGGPQ